MNKYTKLSHKHGFKHPHEYKQWVKAVATGNEADFRLSRCGRYLSKANTRFSERIKQIKKLALKDIVSWMENALTEWRLTGKNPLDKS